MMSWIGSAAGFRGLVVATLLFSLAGISPAWGRSYRSVLKEWTREERVHTWENLELKMVWRAVYLGESFRQARRDKMSSLLDWSQEEIVERIRTDTKESALYDDFLVVIYAGSSSSREFGKDTGHWRIALETGERRIGPITFERYRPTEADHKVYPFIDRWSRVFHVRFPKTVEEGTPFSLKMLGIPTKGELVWK